ncbi:MAG: hypothetical protein ACKPFA_25330, partial [Dolichospermum sp.]
FGGVANPVKLMDMYKRVSVILNKAIGRQLTSVECCLVIDEAAICVVAGYKLSNSSTTSNISSYYTYSGLINNQTALNRS